MNVGDEGGSKMSRRRRVLPMVMLVDDDLGRRSQMRALLRGMGKDVVECSDEPTAMGFLRDEGFQFVSVLTVPFINGHNGTDHAISELCQQRGIKCTIINRDTLANLRSQP